MALVGRKMALAGGKMALVGGDKMALGVRGDQAELMLAQSMCAVCTSGRRLACESRRRVGGLLLKAAQKQHRSRMERLSCTSGL